MKSRNCCRNRNKLHTFVYFRDGMMLAVPHKVLLPALTDSSKGKKRGKRISKMNGCHPISNYGWSQGLGCITGRRGHIHDLGYPASPHFSESPHPVTSRFSF